MKNILHYLIMLNKKVLKKFYKCAKASCVIPTLKKGFLKN